MNNITKIDFNKEEVKKDEVVAVDVVENLLTYTNNDPRWHEYSSKELVTLLEKSNHLLATEILDLFNQLIENIKFQTKSKIELELCLLDITNTRTEKTTYTTLAHRIIEGEKKALMQTSFFCVKSVHREVE